MLAALLLLLLQEPLLEEADHSELIIDLARTEVGLFGGIVLFSHNFESDPQAFGMLHLRAPLPWLSRSLYPSKHDLLGVFLEGGAGRIERDLDPSPDTPDGTFLMGALGIEASLLPEDVWRLRFQAGIEYVHFGKVDDVDSGAGILLGLNLGVALSDRLGITLLPQAHLGGGDALFTFAAAISFRF